MYVRQLWSPTAGFGVDLSAHTALDFAVYGNTSNAERKRHPAIAVSVRLIGGNARGVRDAGPAATRRDLVRLPDPQP